MNLGVILERGYNFGQLMIICQKSETRAGVEPA